VAISKSANISKSAFIHPTSSIWDSTQVRESAVISENCIIGRNVYIGPGVMVGPSCKIQNNALIYEPTTIGFGVFIGPGVVLTNDLNPRAIDSLGNLKSSSDWTLSGVTIGNGASIGANVTCIAPVEIGNWSMIGAGSVVVNDVPDFALVVGNPAKQIGWVGKAGFRLGSTNGIYTHPQDENSYKVNSAGGLEII
jgi:acetyltransferase-like isoleucine patch superfamily enzyme